MQPRELIDVLVDLKECIYYLWRPLLAAVILKLSSLSLRSWREECPIVRVIDWLVTWVLVAFILLIVSTAAR